MTRMIWKTTEVRMLKLLNEYETNSKMYQRRLTKRWSDTTLCRKEFQRLIRVVYDDGNGDGDDKKQFPYRGK